MHYIVMDLEWNQSMHPKDTDPNLTFEIIEIGAIKLDEQMQETDRFSVQIKPKVYRQLHYKIREITRMRMEDLSKGKPFTEAVKAFFDWCGEEYRLCTWGNMDLMELQKNIAYFGAENPLSWPLLYYDVQKLYGLQYDGKNSSKALETAVDELQIEKDVPFHRADADTYYTMRVMQRLDMDRLHRMVSVDYYRLPRKREEEIKLLFDTYSKYVSRGFENSEKAMRDKEVLTTRCPYCGKNAKRRVMWFAANGRSYLCGAACAEHGWLRGKIRLRKHGNGQVYVVKTIRGASEAEIQDLYVRQEEIRMRRRMRRHQEAERRKLQKDKS